MERRRRRRPFSISLYISARSACSCHCVCANWVIMRPETSATASWTVGGRSVPPERQRRRKWPKSGEKVALMYAMLLLSTWGWGKMGVT